MSINLYRLDCHWSITRVTLTTQIARITPREYCREGVPRKSANITANLKRRARRRAIDGRVDGGTRRLIRYALNNRDPYLVQLVTRVEAAEMKIDHLILDTD